MYKDGTRQTGEDMQRYRQQLPRDRGMICRKVNLSMKVNAGARRGLGCTRWREKHTEITRQQLCEISCNMKLCSKGIWYILWLLKVLHVQAEILQGIKNVEGKESQVRVVGAEAGEKEETGWGKKKERRKRRREWSRSELVIVVVVWWGWREGGPAVERMSVYLARVRIDLDVMGQGMMRGQCHQEAIYKGWQLSWSNPDVTLRQNEGSDRDGHLSLLLQGCHRLWSSLSY